MRPETLHGKDYDQPSKERKGCDVYSTLHARKSWTHGVSNEEKGAVGCTFCATHSPWSQCEVHFLFEADGAECSDQCCPHASWNRRSSSIPCCAKKKRVGGYQDTESMQNAFCQFTEEVSQKAKRCIYNRTTDFTSIFSYN